MGTSTDAILAFGFDLGDPEDGELDKLLEAGRENDEDEDTFDPDTLLARDAGVQPPTVEYGEATKHTFEAYWKAKREAVEAHPLDVISHCSGNCPMYFLAVRGTESRALRGYPESNISLPEVSAESVQAMREFCERYGITFKTPSWCLFSDWS